jgi:hypothetical protein
VAGCARCGEVFASRSAFDKHQSEAGSVCNPPGERGLILVEKTYAGERWLMWACPPPANFPAGWKI